MIGVICIEGAQPRGKGSKYSKLHCREAFAKLFLSAGVKTNRLTIVACGSREESWKKFQGKLSLQNSFVALLVDSESQPEDGGDPWRHFLAEDAWKRPPGVADDQALLMITCMEAWVVADQKALRRHFGKNLQESALPSLVEIERKHKKDIQDSLTKATRQCTHPYSKGDRSFDVLAELNPDVLSKHLPSFRRTISILKEKIK